MLSSTFPRRIAIFGSTGSIGTQALDVLSGLEGFRVVALAAGSNVKLLTEQAAQWRVTNLILANADAAKALPGARFGCEAMQETAASPDVDDVLVAISGAAGVAISMAAARAGKRILLANKETLVCAGALFMQTVRENGAELLPVDSEHSAIFQCLQGQPPPKRLVLTASGGPFLGKTREELRHVTFEQAMAHPTWRMGWKITLDSATLLNKGMELLEACVLFDLPPERVEVVVHPQSILHSAVVFEDESMIGQLGWPDMRLPIQYALTYPARCASPQRALHLAELGNISFQKPDEDTFRCLALARQAYAAGGVAGAVYNAAGEGAAQAFRQGAIGFLDIADCVQSALVHAPTLPLTLENMIKADTWARAHVAEKAKQEKGNA